MKISENFNFLELNFGSYHCTDNTVGSPMNYIAYMRRGKVKLVASGGDTVCAESGDVIFIPYKLPYRSYWYGEPDVSFLSLGFLNIEATEKMDFVLQRVDCDPALRERIASIPADATFPHCATLGLFYSALADLLPYLRSREKPSKAQEVVDRAKSYILKHTECSIPELARACFVSEPYLFACFKEKACCSPNEWRLKAISRKGAEYIRTTDMSVEEIAVLVGLSSSAHLRRLLKKYIGLTPREIRKSRDF